jgi:hypothetical protein
MFQFTAYGTTNTVLRKAVSAKRKGRRGARKLWEHLRMLASAGRAPGENIELTASIAARLKGVRRTEFVLRASVLQKNSRALIRLHEVVSAAAPDSKSPMLRIIEKRSIKPEEHAFYRIAADQKLEAAPAPELYAAFDAGFAIRDPLRYVVYLEHLPRPGLPDQSTETAYRLADSISAVARLKLPPTFRPRRAIQLSEDLLSEFLRHAGAAGRRDTAACRGLEKMAIEWPQILMVRALGLPVLPSHNDLHVRNICLVRGPRAEEFVFIDWEAFGMNYAGADLHHFLRDAVLKPDLFPFFQALRSRFLERVRDIHSVDSRMIDLGAHAYALTRSMSRVIKGGRTCELHLSLEISNRLKQLLAA